MSEIAGNRPEVLAPAGGWESLEAAVRCGADAVYLGGKSLNARRAAQGFDDGQLRQAVSHCHVRGVKLYLTLNTLVFDSEWAELERAVRLAADIGVDAVIVQDLAAAALVRRCAPALPLHASTQMSVHDAAGVRMLGELGFSRVVLARELSREELRLIRSATDLELECFVHGALCMCVSGQCYLSSMIGGRSGNRGLCAQPCRLPFSPGGSAQTPCVKEYALSLRDLSLIRRIGELEALGVAGLKIEGRMKRPEYVAAAVTACRAALNGETPDYTALEAVFSRGGFTSGYYDGLMGPEMFGIRGKEDVQSAAPVLKGLAALYKDERQSVPVSMEFSLRRGSPARLRVRDEDGNAVTAEGPVAEEARTAPTTPEKAASALGKTGGTPYTARNILSEIDDGLILPASALNALRRDAMDRLTDLRGAAKPYEYTDRPAEPDLPYRARGKPKLRVRVSRAAQVTAALMNADEIVIPAEEFAACDRELLARSSEKLLVEIPGIVFDNRAKLDKLLQSVKELGVGRAMVGGLGGIGIARDHGLAAHGDYGLNIVSTQALEEYRKLGLRDATVSFELSLPQIRGLGGSLPRGLLTWGHLPLMATRNCPAGGCGSCGRSFPTLTDRMGNVFFVDCVWQVARLYNHVPLFLADRLAELPAVDFLTLYFTRESPGECVELLERYRHGGKAILPITRGLYYRKVL